MSEQSQYSVLQHSPTGPSTTPAAAQSWSQSREPPASVVVVVEVVVVIEGVVIVEVVELLAFEVVGVVSVGQQSS